MAASGKIIGPIRLALIVGSSNIVKPDVTIAAIVPCFLYLGAWSALAGFAFAFIGFETKGRSLEEIDQGLVAGRSPVTSAVEVSRPERLTAAAQPGTVPSSSFAIDAGS